MSTCDPFLIGDLARWAMIRKQQLELGIWVRRLAGVFRDHEYPNEQPSGLRDESRSEEETPAKPPANSPPPEAYGGHTGQVGEFLNVD
jgi:hypothetical protein